MQFSKRISGAAVFFVIVFAYFSIQTWFQFLRNVNNVDIKNTSKEVGNFLLSIELQINNLFRKIKRLKILNRRSPLKDIKQDILNHGEQQNCSPLVLMIMITSNLKHFERRQVIRDTYGNLTVWDYYLKKRGISVGLVFLVGNDVSYYQKLRNESTSYGDLLMIDLVENFYSLSYKVMIGFQWAYQSCNIKYLLKCDDDIFVSIHALVTLLSDPSIPTHNLYLGNLFYSSQSSVVRVGRYGVSRKEWPRDNYASYNSGGGFLLTFDVIKQIIPFYNWGSPLKIDDAYIGDLILQAGIKATASNLFNMFGDKCQYNRTTIVLHIDSKTLNTRQCSEFINELSLKDANSYLAVLSSS